MRRFDRGRRSSLAATARDMVRASPVSREVGPGSVGWESVVVRKAKMRSLAAAAAVAVVGVTACATPAPRGAGAPLPAPSGWTHGKVERHRLHVPRAALVHHVYCRSDSGRTPHTSLRVWVIPSDYFKRGSDHHLEVLQRYASRARRRRTMEVTRPIEPAGNAGSQVLSLEIESLEESPNAPSPTAVTNRLWSIAARDRVVLLLAREPSPADPRCSADLEAALREVIRESSDLQVGRD